MRSRQKVRTITAAAELTSLFYAQSWSLCHYLWHAGDGRHREKLIAYLGKELTGEGGYEALAEILAPDGLDPDALETLERDWRAHVADLMDR